MSSTLQAKARRSTLELAGAMALYLVTLVVSLKAGSSMDEGAGKTIVSLLPMLPFALAIWAVVRAFRRNDEFLRQSTLQHVAVAAAVTAGWTFTYGFLETAGYPRLSMFTVWPVMGAVWGALAIVGLLRQPRAS